jgi:hypothetical protein
MAVSAFMGQLEELVFAGTTVAVALACLALPVIAADTVPGGASQDSTQVGESDDAGGQSGESLGSKKAPEGLWEAHPLQIFKVTKNKDVTNWDNSINLSKQLSSKLSLNLSGTVTARENSTLNRSDANNGANAGLRYQLNQSLAFSVDYNTSVSAYRYDLSRNAPADRRKSQDITVSSQLTRRILDAVDINVRAGAGSTSNSFEAISNQGRRMDLTAGVTYAPQSNLRTSTTFTGKRLFLSSKVDSGGLAVFTSQDKTFSENLAFSLSYEMLPGVRLGMDASNNEDQRQHPDPVEKKQETERKSSKNASVTSSFEMWKWLTWDMAVKFSSSNNRYDIRSISNSKSGGADLTVSAKILPWRSATVNLGGEREATRDQYVTSDSGNNLRKSLSFKLSQGLGPKGDLGLSAISDFTSTVYDDKKANPRDRDRLSNRVALDANYDPYANVSTNLGGEFSEERTAYLRAEESANNRTMTKYRVYGRYDVTTRYAIAISQNYDVGAVYTIYVYGGGANNSLVRNSNVSTSFRIPVTPALGLNLDHNYRYQDQGSYREEGSTGRYGLAAANESNTLRVGLRYALGKGLNLNIGQAYSVQSNWSYKKGKKQLDYETRSTDISGRIGFKHNFGPRTNLSAAVELNRNEGSRVSAAFRKYWNFEFEASHTF